MRPLPDLRLRSMDARGWEPDVRADPSEWLWPLGNAFEESLSRNIGANINVSI